MTIHEEFQTLVDELDKKYRTKWHIALIKAGTRVEALNIIKRTGSKSDVSKQFLELTKLAIKKRLPVIMKPSRSVGDKYFLMRRGFKQLPDSKWGKMWVKLPKKYV